MAEECLGGAAMIRVAISVEGDTEETFVKEILYGLFLPMNIWITPINMRGNISLDRIVPDLVRLYHSHNFVTTFYDFYGFKRNNYIDGSDLEDKICSHVKESLIRNDQELDPRRFRPYIQMHEFEGLLFSDVAGFNILTDVTVKHIDVLKAVRHEFASPEDINNSKETAPSKRILSVGFNYDKVEHGPLIALEIGIDKIRRECPRFNEWMIWLEGLGAA